MFYIDRKIRKINRKVKRFLIAAALVIGYAAVSDQTGLHIPCPFRSLTGFKCPGCGITGVINGLLTLDFERAFEANAFLTVTSPFLLYEIIREFLLPRPRGLSRKINSFLLTVYLAAFLAYGVWRNIA